MTGIKEIWPGRTTGRTTRESLNGTGGASARPSFFQKVLCVAVVVFFVVLAPPLADAPVDAAQPEPATDYSSGHHSTENSFHGFFPKS